jgi:acetyl-CoA synthetase
LKSLGVKKGDRVVVYMPLCIEGVASMLACARIGAVHSVVYAGFSVQALRSRIEEAQAKVVMTADIGFRRGKREIVQRVVVYRRIQPVIELSSSHSIDSYELIAKQSPNCPAEVMDSEDPLFFVYQWDDREAEGRGACPRRLHGGDALPHDTVLGYSRR